MYEYGSELIDWTSRDRLRDALRGKGYNERFLFGVCVEKNVIDEVCLVVWCCISIYRGRVECR